MRKVSAQYIGFIHHSVLALVLVPCCTLAWTARSHHGHLPLLNKLTNVKPSFTNSQGISNSLNFIVHNDNIIGRRNDLSYNTITCCRAAPTQGSLEGDFRRETNKNLNNDYTSSSVSRREWFTRATNTAAATAGIVSSVGFGSAFNNCEAAETMTSVITTNAVCDTSVSVWQRDDRIIYLLGSAHISSQSAETAGQLVRDTNPDAVFVELDLKRVTGSSNMKGKLSKSVDAPTGNASNSIAIIPGEKQKQKQLEQKSANVVDVDVAASSSSSMTSSSESIKEPQQQKTQMVLVPKASNNNLENSEKGQLGIGALAVGSAIKGMYKKLDSAGFDAGSEFVTAIEEGRKIGSSIVLGDQNVDITLRRLFMALQKTDLQALLLNPDNELEQTMKQILPSENVQKGLSGDAAFKDDLSTYVETMKAKENVKLIMSQLKKVAPLLYQVMVAERDTFMALGLNTLNEYPVIVAVMGIAHVDGVEENLSMNGWKRVGLKCPP